MKHREAFWWYMGIIERLVSMDGKDGMLCMEFSCGTTKFG